MKFKISENDKKFKSNYNITFIMILFGAAVMLINLAEKGMQENIIQGMFFWAGSLLLLFLIEFFALVIITGDKRLICRKPFGLHSFDINISDITKIDRTSEFIFKNMGSRLQIYYKNNFGGEDWHTIREANYDIEIIKDLLKDLKKINGLIELHPQYYDLINGKIKFEDDFKDLPIKN